MESGVTPLSTVFTSARVVLAIVFLVAGLPKLIVRERFLRTLRALGVEHKGAVLVLRTGVPIAETALGVWLLTSSYPVAASFVAAALLATFTRALINLRKRDAGGCACFVWDDHNVGAAHVLRNLVLVAIAASTGIVTILGLYTWEPVWQLSAQSTLVVLASVAFLFVLYALIVRSLQFAGNSVADL